MKYSTVPFILIAVGLLSVGCTRGDGTRRATDDGDAATAEPDAGDRGAPASTADAGVDYTPVDECDPGCGPLELCGDMGDGDGLDNDCDGSVDEDCVCSSPGVSRACFRGPPDRQNVGICADGTMTCSEFLTWSSCNGGQFPVAEVCDGADNDCNGVEDDGLTDCNTTLACPGSAAARPLTDHLLRGAPIYTGAARSWNWTVECPEGVSPCPAPNDPAARDTTIYFISSGNYRARLDVVTEEGEEVSCDWIIYVQGTGLRVELNWDTRGSGNGDTDVDLHLHRRTVPEDAFTGETDFFTEDDCYYSNCKASSYDDDLRAAWNLPDTADLDACRNAPHSEGGYWEDEGACFNPRLDVDIIYCDPTETDASGYSFCAPENVNIDNPSDGATYRIMVNYYSNHSHEGVTLPTVSVFCGGELRGAFGSDPLVTLANGDSFGENNDNWLVADVKFFTDSCGRVECEINPLGMVQTGPAFGPEWSF